MKRASPRGIRLIITLAAALLLSLAAAQGTCTNLSVLSWAHFIKASDTDLQKVLNNFGEANNINVQLDTISLNDLPAKVAAAMQSQSGADVILLTTYSTALYANQLIPLNGVISAIEKNYSPFLPIGEEASKINGTWKSVPWFYTPAPANVRTDYFKAAGVKPPDTWEELLKDAKPLQAEGHPVGLAISAAADSNDWLLQMMASFGAHAVDAQGHVAIDSAATRKALDYVRKLAKYMPPDVMGWDSGGNNTFMLSGVGSWTINPVSIYLSAKSNLPDVAKNLEHTLPPAGPKGRFATTTVYTLGIPKWSPCQDTAKKLIEYMFQPKNYEGWITASGGYNIPLFQKFPKLDVWTQDPKMFVPQEMGKFMHLALWPAPPTLGAKLQQIYNSYVIPTMFGKAVKGANDDEAIKWASKQLTQILNQ
jgi:multiple sugar transport system substrate-binding protein